MIYGGDYLGGMHFERDMLVAHARGGVGGIMLRTFGDARKTSTKMAESGKFAEILIHLYPFDRSHNYNIARAMPGLRKDTAFCAEIAKQYGAKILISPFCEHLHPTREMIPVFAELKKIAPMCEFVNSGPIDQEVPGVIQDVHLSNSSFKRKPKGPYTVSFDGFGSNGEGDFSDANIPEILEHYKDARHIRCWDFRFNGKSSHLDTTPIQSRRAWPSYDYIVGKLHQMRTRQGKESWPDTQLWKPFADDHGGGPMSKDNRALAILPLPSEIKRVYVYDIKGLQIDTLFREKKDHTGEPKGGRFYSRLYAYQIGNRAQERTGSRLIRVGDSPYTDVDFRSGRFR